MSKMLITRGICGSGKSFWSEQYLAQATTPTAYVNKDTIRWQLFGRYDSCNEHEVHLKMLEQIAQAIGDGVDILIDNMHLKDRDVRQLTKIANEAGYFVEIHDFRDVPLEVCLDRNSKRGRVVPEDVIRNYHKRYIAGRF